MFRHLKDNKGDANVSKMVLIATVFVVGAILLVLITSAFRNPINRWFEKVSNDWFASENGEFNLMNNPFANYERNENGTISGVEYVYLSENGNRCVLLAVEGLLNGVANQEYAVEVTQGPGGSWDDVARTVSISDDGMSITIDGTTYTAQTP